MRQILVCAFALVMAATVVNAAHVYPQIGPTCRACAIDSPPPDWPTPPKQPSVTAVRNFDSPPPDWPTPPKQPTLTAISTFDSPPPDWPTPNQPPIMIS